MSTPTANPWFLVGAAVVGLVSAAGMFLAEHFRQEKKRQAMSQDLARLDQQLSVMFRELETLRALQKQNATKNHKSRRGRPSSVVSSGSTDEYASALEIDSSDLEFYDLSDEESVQTVTPLDKVLADIDKILDEGTSAQLTAVLEQLKDLNIEYPDNAELLWRLGRAHYKISEKAKHVDERKELIGKGIEACEEALMLNPKCAEGHKWLAILVGSRSDYQPIRDRVADGHLFKKHLDIALELRPNDYSLHHLLGRYAHDVAGLKWYERKAAAALFGELPQTSYDQALAHFFEAERLVDKEWKENKLMIAKCYLAMKDYESAVDWLGKAETVPSREDLDDKIDTEIKSLLKTYNSYR